MVRSFAYSGVLLAILIPVLALTDLGKTYPRFATAAVRVWREGRRLTFAQRQRSIYHETFQVLQYVREAHLRCRHPAAAAGVYCR